MCDEYMSVETTRFGQRLENVNHTSELPPEMALKGLRRDSKGNEDSDGQAIECTL